MPAKALMPGVWLVSWGGDMELLLRAKARPDESYDDAFWRILAAAIRKEDGACHE